MLDTVSYPDPAVAAYVADHFVSYKAWLESRDDWPLFRQNHAIWTPTVGFFDRNGAMHYHSPGYLPPLDFLAVLRIGRARCLMAWSRWEESEAELEAAAEPGGALAAEALYWLGVSRFLQRRNTAGMWEAWERLTALYPGSPWARRVYPRTH